MISSEFLYAKFLWLIDHPQKLQNFHTMKITGDTL